MFDKNRKAFGGSLFLITLLCALCKFASAGGELASPGGIGLEGSGTVVSPYLVQSLEDLSHFRDLVNGGYDFSGEYVLQTCDIDMSAETNWKPAGEYGSGHYFYGIYNGGGHALSNLTIYRPGENVGLFGQLGGTVSNLGIDSGRITGACAGSIAGHSTGEDALILNCYNRAGVFGNRAGGIADNFSGGMVIDCWNEGIINGEYVSGTVIGYDARALISCGAKDQPFVNEYFTGMIISGKRDLPRTDDYLNTFYSHVRTDVPPLKQFVSQFFAGKGTEEEPYCISSTEELEAFREAVNAGYSFYNEWVRQTEDLDLAEAGEWIPIGIFAGNHYFFGTYDGDGHTVSHLRIDREDNAGFFGQLGGTILNLGIESGYISGQCSAALASHGTGTPMIVNCYNRATVHGTLRAAGIADNFVRGAIANCYNTGIIICDQRGMAAELCSYDANRIMFSYSANSGMLVSEAFAGTIENTSEGGLSMELISQKLNDSLYDVATRTNLQRNQLYTYTKAGAFRDRYDYRTRFLFRCLALAAGLAALLWGLRKYLQHRCGSLSTKSGSVSGALRFPDGAGLFTGLFLICAFCSAVLWLAGDHLFIRGFIWSEGEDAFMDFFNPLFYVVNNNYKTEGYYTNSGNYPPVARGILWVLGQLFPYKYTLTSPYDLRTNSVGLLLWVSLFAVCTFLLWKIYRKELPGNRSVLSGLLLMTVPMINAFERGNIVILSFTLSVVFMAFYDHDKKGFRLMAYICLALAAAIKIYPAVLGIMVIRRKRIREIIALAAIGIVIAAGPFFLIGGIQTIQDYLSNLMLSSQGAVSRFYPHYINFSNVMHGICDRIQISYQDLMGTFHIALMVLVGLLLLISIVSRERYKACLALTSIMILYPGFSCTYMMLFNIIPIVALFREKEQNWMSRICLTLVSLSLVPIQFLCGVVGAAREDIWIFYGYLGVAIAAVLIVDFVCGVIIRPGKYCGKNHNAPGLRKEPV